jgi:hypothetical protein
MVRLVEPGDVAFQQHALVADPDRLLVARLTQRVASADVHPATMDEVVRLPVEDPVGRVGLDRSRSAGAERREDGKELLGSIGAGAWFATGWLLLRIGARGSSGV